MSIRKVYKGNDNFRLDHVEGKLYAVAVVDGITRRFDVTAYFEEGNPHDDWLDYKLMLKYDLNDYDDEEFEI